MKSLSWFVFSLASVTSLCVVGCSQAVDGGRPEALNPILGGRLVAHRHATKPSEPVEDHAVDLGPFKPAWPAVGAELPRLVTAIIARGSWTDEHHAAIAVDGVLHVRHRPAVVKQVRKLIQELRGRLLLPLNIQVAYVEVKARALTAVFNKNGKRPGGRWRADAFHAAAGRGEARTLARVVLTGYNGQWVLSDRVSNQAFMSGVTVADGSLTPQSTTLASGFTIQAAAWRWGAERAVCAMTGLYTGAAVGAQSITQKVHRELPRVKTTERQWEGHDVKLELPVREMMEFQNQLTVTKNQWTVAALLPRDRGLVNVVVVKVNWRGTPVKKTTVDPLSSSRYRLDVIPIALPTDTRPFSVTKMQTMDNRNEISKNSASWFRNRARSFQQTQKKNTYNLKDKQGNLYFSPSRSQSVRSSKTSGHYQKVQQAMPSTLAKKEASAGVLMPPKLEKLRAEVMLAGWPRGTALEFLANHVFVVHEPSMTKKVRALLDKTHVWRNRRIFIDAAFPVLTQRAADGLEGTGLSASQAARHRKGSTMMPEAFIQARGGSWGEIFVGRMHTVISGAWAPDRSSPPVHVYWKGARLALQPRLGPGDDMMVDLRWKQHRLSNVAPRVVAGTILQQPVDSTWATDKPFLVKPGRSALTGMHGHEGSLQALLLMVRAR